MRVYNTVGSDSLLSRQLSISCLVRFGPGEKVLRRFIALKKLLLELIHIASVFFCFFLVMLGYSMRFLQPLACLQICALRSMEVLL